MLHNLPAGDWDAGERGIACHPDRVGGVPRGRGARDRLRQGAGRAAAQLPGRQAARPAYPTTYCARRWSTTCATPRSELKAEDIRLLVEPINQFDIPGFYLSRTDQALALIDEVGGDNLFLQYDIYHAQRMEGELAATLREAHRAHRPRAARRQPGPQRARHRRDQLPVPVRPPRPPRLRRLDRLRIQARASRPSRPGLARSALAK